jgi:hypothetical protein
MAFKLKDLSVLAYANGFTLWHYRTADADTDVDDADYFLEAIDMLRPGDMILANTGEGTAPKGGIFRVASNDGTTIDATNMTEVGATNT